MSDKLSEEELEYIRLLLSCRNTLCIHADPGRNMLAEIDRLRAENNELREEDLNGTKATVKAIEQITYYRNEVNRLNNVIAERDTRIDTLQGELTKVHELLDRLPVDIDELLSEE